MKIKAVEMYPMFTFAQMLSFAQMLTFAEMCTFAQMFAFAQMFTFAQMLAPEAPFRARSARAMRAKTCVVATRQHSTRRFAVPKTLEDEHARVLTLVY